MDHPPVLHELAGNREIFKQILKEVPREMIMWKPGPDKWNLLEIICHLVDEEKEDFRYRVQHTLDNPERPMPAIDPQGWVLSRNYAGQSYGAKVEEFVKERNDSVKWLESLRDPNWNAVCEHPKLGPLSAWMFLNNWVAHDYLHIRQIVHLKYCYLGEKSSVDLSYAGNW